jgi:predicted PurR-regulated permease PerM
MTSTSPPSSDARQYVRRVTTAVGLTLLLLGMLVLFGALFQVLLLVFMAVLIILPLRGAARWVHEKGGWPMPLAAAAVVLAIIGTLTGAVLLLGPSISDQVAEGRRQLPALIERADAVLNETSWGADLLDRLPDPETLVAGDRSGLKRIFGVVSGTFGVLADAYIVFFLVLFLGSQPRLYTEGLVALVPPSGRQRARHVLAKLGEVLLKWLTGKLLAMAVVGILTYVGLLLIGMPLAAALALFATLLAFVPNFGPVIALLPAVLLALPQGGSQVLYVVLIYGGAQFVESTFFTPLIQKRMVNIPPALIILSQVILGVFVGGLGLALADGLIVIVMVLVKMLYLQDWLRDDTVKV